MEGKVHQQVHISKWQGKMFVCSFFFFQHKITEKGDENIPPTVKNLFTDKKGTRSRFLSEVFGSRTMCQSSAIPIFPSNPHWFIFS